eukprot:366039-Chlamydomonas_euryale.AAC.25
MARASDAHAVAHEACFGCATSMRVPRGCRVAGGCPCGAREGRELGAAGLVRAAPGAAPGGAAAARAAGEAAGAGGRTWGPSWCTAAGRVPGPPAPVGHHKRD